MTAAPAKAVAFRDLVERVAYAACRDMTRPTMQGVWLEQETPESLLAVATDGHRLALTRGRFAFPLPVGKRGQGAFVPSGELGLLSKLAPKRKHYLNLDLRASVDGGRIRFESDLGALDARLDVEFPDWRRVKPNPKAGTGYTLEPGASAIVRELAKYAGELRRILVTVGPQEALFEVCHDARVMIRGEARVKVTDWPLNADALPPTVAVNAYYLADALEQVGGAAELHVGEAKIYGPLLVRGPHGEAVVMPMRR